MALDVEKSKDLWQGRSWIPTPGDIKLRGIDRAVRFLSYNVFADSKALFVNHSTNTKWDTRSRALLDELKSYDADIMCLQDVDHFKEFWRPKLMLLGYESIFKGRTQLKDYHSEGVVIAFKSNLFQLFKTVYIEFNNGIDEAFKGAAFQDRCKTDDVGLIVFLAPFAREYIKSAICVGCAMLSDNERDNDVRAAHSQYFANQIELANKEFHVPVLMGLNLNDTPASLSYNLLLTGRQPLIAQVPNKCPTPVATATCRSAVQLKWMPPYTTLADLPILSYTIAWRPGASRTLGFRSQVNIGIGECVKYAERVDEKGSKRVVALDEKQYIITGLVSDVPYEFKICALNEMGEGIWSDISVPVVLKNPEKAPAMPALENFATLTELNEGREVHLMGRLDWDVHYAYKADPMSSLTQLTPRDRDGNILNEPRSSILPINANPRLGWKEAMHGTQDPKMIFEMNRESVIASSILRNHDGFINTDLNQYYDGVMVNVNTGLMCLSSNQAATPAPLSLLTNGAASGGGALVPTSSGAVAAYTNQEPDSHVDNVPTIRQTVLEKSSVLLDGKEAMAHIGAPNERQVHDLSLASAYDSYSSGGEPLFTMSVPKEKHRHGVECVDYIMYTKTHLVPIRTLSLPVLSQLQQDGENPQESMTRVDNLLLAPFHCAKDTFDARLNKLNQDLTRRSTGDDDDNGSLPIVKPTAAGSPGKKIRGVPTINPPPDKAKVNEYKRRLKDILNKSRNAGNNLAPPPVSSTASVANAATTATAMTGASFASVASMPSVASSHSTAAAAAASAAALREAEQNVLWGGKWAPFPQDNHQRANCWLPNNCYHSTHLALCADFIIDDKYLSTQWQ